MEKKVAVLQSNYLPWKGYFDIINDVDLFIFYDDVQYTKNDWRNRNKIKTKTGEHWLTVPVGKSLNRKIYEVDIPNHKWQIKHWKSIEQGYSKSPGFDLYKDMLKDIYLNNEWRNLSNLNQYIIEKISQDVLEIDTKFDYSDNYQLAGEKQSRLLDLLTQVKATSYVSGPSAKDYIDNAEFEKNNIKLIYKNYGDYPIYKQLSDSFNHHISIIDLLMCTGKEASHYIWDWRNQIEDRPGILS